MKRFLWGVEGVRLAGSEEVEKFVGGVLDLDGSFTVVEWVEVRSGERLGGVGWGIVVSNNSDRRRVEKVRFASSAAENQTKIIRVRKRLRSCAHSSGSGALREESFSCLSMASQAMHRHVVG